MANGETTTNEIMEFLQEHMVTREEFSHLEAKVDGLEAKVDGLDQKINKTKLEILDAMDDKLADLKGDLVILMRKEDQKVNGLIKLLTERNVITEKDALNLMEIRPFPQSVA